MNPLYRNDRPGEIPKSWYADTADLPDLRPDLRGQLRADVCIVGAGFTGLTAALHLAGRGLRVVVLEVPRVGFAVLGRNGRPFHSGVNPRICYTPYAPTHTPLPAPTSPSIPYPLLPS